jgi:hypothetical protein
MIERIQVSGSIERGQQRASVLVKAHSNMKDGRVQDLFLNFARED